MMTSGFLIVDKPGGMTSFDVVAQVRRAFKIKKVGHLGTLDPLGTGVLVVALGEGTKLIEYMMGLGKVYEAQIEFGKVSNTYDREGKIEIQTKLEPLMREAVENALHAFVGEISQKPPAFSAIKVKGRRAYALARQGETVELEPRQVTIHSLFLQGFHWPYLNVKIECSSGTYIRSLAHDLGRMLGVGAVLDQLRRTAVGTFMLAQAISLDTLKMGDPSLLISLESIVENWSQFSLSDTDFKTLRHGRSIPLPSYFPKLSEGPPVCGLHEGRLVSLLHAQGREVHVVKNFNRS